MLTLDKCEQMGAEACAARNPPTVCPFAPSAAEWESWMAGYEEVGDFLLGLMFSTLPYITIAEFLPITVPENITTH